jgi:hypothetical protein
MPNLGLLGLPLAPMPGAPSAVPPAGPLSEYDQIKDIVELFRQIFLTLTKNSPFKRTSQFDLNTTTSPPILTLQLYKYFQTVRNHCMLEAEKAFALTRQTICKQRL